jgi:hypothetical protein
MYCCWMKRLNSVPAWVLGAVLVIAGSVWLLMR